MQGLGSAAHRPSLHNSSGAGDAQPLMPWPSSDFESASEIRARHHVLPPEDDKEQRLINRTRRPVMQLTQSY